MSVLKVKDVSFKTFDEYRYHQYVACNTLIQSLVSSSCCIRNGHIMRLFYVISRLSSLLDTHFVSMDPRNYSWLDGEKWPPPLRQMPPPITTSPFENMKVMQRLLNQKMCVGNFLEAAQYTVVAVQNVKIFTTLCPSD